MEKFYNKLERFIDKNALTLITSAIFVLLLVVFFAGLITGINIGGN
jgi:hypothetical protein